MPKTESRAKKQPKNQVVKATEELDVAPVTAAEDKALFVDFQKSQKRFYRQRFIFTIFFFVAYGLWKISSFSKEVIAEEDQLINCFNTGEKLSLSVYLTEGMQMRNTELLFKEGGLEYRSKSGKPQLHQKIKIPKDKLLRNNYLYVELNSYAYEIKYILKDDTQNDPRPIHLHSWRTLVDLTMSKRTKRKSIGLASLNTMESKKSVKKLENKPGKPQTVELSNPKAAQAEQSRSAYRKNLFVHLIYEDKIHSKKTIPEYLRTYENYYQPLLDLTQFWSLERDAVYPEDIGEELEFTIDFDTISESQFTNQQVILMTFKDEAALKVLDPEDIKEILTDNSTFYLYTVLTVNILHIFFTLIGEFYEVKFWKNKKNHHGLSISQVYFNGISSVVTYLYLREAEAQKILIIMTGVDVLISLWKCKKVTNFEKRPDGKFPFLRIRNEEQYEAVTSQIEKKSIKLMLKILFPIFLIYTGYKFFTEPVNNYYHFILQTVMSFFVMFGFIQMTPQLFINYKLKTVEHMNWTSMSYKFLNTIIDDLFAFMVPMPTLKRISMFRDDVVFLIYLYQRRLYRVDENRTESGFIDDDLGAQGVIADQIEDVEPSLQKIEGVDRKGKTEQNSSEEEDKDQTQDMKDKQLHEKKNKQSLRSSTKTSDSFQLHFNSVQGDSQIQEFQKIFFS